MKPILFNTEMVKAILEGRKTVTRRIMKPQPQNGVTRLYKIPNGHVFEGFFGSAENDAVYATPFKSGDILYVRETWAKIRHVKPKYAIPDDYQEISYLYRADGEIANGDGTPFKWNPSIHMPKEAARIFLRVQSVRVERLQDCGNAQAKDEGFTCCSQFSRLWDTTIKSADLPKYGWDANPWVWVIEFERCEKPEEDKP